MEVIFCSITKRKLNFGYSLCLDILLLFGIFLQFLDITSRGLSPDLAKPYNVFLNSVMSLVVWMKIGAFVMITRGFGVYIRMFQHMLPVIFNFLFILFMYMIAFAMIFTVLFSTESSFFASYFTTLVNLFNTAMTNFDNRALFDNPRTAWWGSLFFILTFVVVTAVFLLNMIVAVLNNVYVRVSDKIDADHNATLVSACAAMRFDSKYGLLIFSFPPLNVLSFLLMPFLLSAHFFASSDRTIKTMNTVFCQITHFPLAVLLFTLFLLLDLFFLPLAYLKSFFLFPLRGRSPAHRVLHLLSWPLLGPFLLVRLVLHDLLSFVRVLYRKPHTSLPDHHDMLQ